MNVHINMPAASFAMVVGSSLANCFDYAAQHLLGCSEWLRAPATYICMWTERKVEKVHSMYSLANCYGTIASSCSQRNHRTTCTQIRTARAHTHPHTHAPDDLPIWRSVRKRLRRHSKSAPEVRRIYIGAVHATQAAAVPAVGHGRLVLPLVTSRRWMFMVLRQTGCNYSYTFRFGLRLRFRTYINEWVQWPGSWNKI